MKYFVLPLLLIMLLSGCGKKDGDADHQEEAVKRTAWTKKSELFVEYTGARVGKKCQFLLHITDLAAFKPVTEGAIVLTFVQPSGEPFAIKIEGPAKPGIFRAEAVFKMAGRHAMKVALGGKTFSDEVVLEGIEVKGAKNGDEHKPPPEKEGYLIAFSKEQQWRIDFKTEYPSRQTLSSSFVSAGEFIPLSRNEVTVSAPLTGILSVSKRLPFLGQKIGRDEVIAQIEPAVSQQGGIGQLSAAYSESRNRVVLARKEWERAKRLYEAKAVPKRRLEEAELALDSATAALRPLELAVESMKKGASGNRIVVRSPLNGTVAELLVSNGKAVEAGQPLLRIIDTSTLWLRANIPATEIGKVKSFSQATFSVAGIGSGFNPTRLVAISDVVDAKSRTVPVIFEVSNPRALFKAGMFADVSVRTGQVENGVTLPEAALFEDEGRFFVFVQRDGESFERREVSVGIRGNGYAHITKGIEQGERIVTKGGYYVKLASLSSKPQGHGHEH
ncbi:MAG TPA: efflux RND transporter periplasmic adaptor subunit [Syntrophorhabdaceae bacterium]|jgi:RND family efflux transporter MFP subunit